MNVVIEDETLPQIRHIDDITHASRPDTNLPIDQDTVAPFRQPSLNSATIFPVPNVEQPLAELRLLNILLRMLSPVHQSPRPLNHNSSAEELNPLV